MKIYLVMQSEKLRFGKPSGPSRIRTVFVYLKEAIEYIGPVHEKYINCKECGHKCVNEKADLDSNYEPWRKKLFIKEWNLDTQTYRTLNQKGEQIYL